MIIWTIGYSGAGKNRTYEELSRYIKNMILIDGDFIRKYINKDLGYSNEDRLENHLRVAYMCKTFCSKDKIYYVAMMTPTFEIRNLIKSILPDVKFLFINTSLNYCIKKNNKNIYDNKYISGIDLEFDTPNEDEIEFWLNTYDFYNYDEYIKNVLILSKNINEVLHGKNI